MALNIAQLKSRLNSLSSQNTNKKSDLIWKPKPGKQVVRIIPYKYNPENPFIELKFHYNTNGKTYLSPDSFSRPDPIVEFANRLKHTGSKEDWLMGRKMEPKMRTFAPIIVRGEESEGVKFWGFGKQVYQEIGALILDGEFGDITDVASGRDITVEFKTAEESGKSFPITTIRPRGASTPAVDPSKAELVESLKNQTNILDLFPELSYDELKDIMDKWLNPETGEAEAASVSVADGTDDDADIAPVATVKPTVKPTSAPVTAPKTASPSAAKSKAGASTDVEKAFDDLFNS